MGTVVHPHVCTVEVPHHLPGDKVADDMLVISYHNHPDGSGIDALLLPCRDLGKQPTATVLGVPTEDPIDQSADNTSPNFDDSRGNKSEHDVPKNDVFAALSGDSGPQSAGNAALIPHHNPEDRSAVEAPANPSNGTTHQAANDDRLTKSLFLGGQLAEPVPVTLREDSEDKSAEITSDDDPGHQTVDDAFVISDHHLKKKASEDKPADANLTVSHQNPVDQSANEVLVISCHEAENPSANENLRSRDSISGGTPGGGDQLVSFDDLGSETPNEAPKTSDHCSKVRSGKDILTASGNNSGDKSSGNASLELAHNKKLSGESDALLVAKDETENRYAGETSVEPAHDSEHQITNEVLVSNRSEDTSAEHAIAVSDHELHGKEDDKSISAANETAERNYPNDAVVLPDTSGHEHTDEGVLISNHDSGKQHGDDAHLTLSHRPEVRPLDNVLLAASHDSGDQSAGESLIISYHDSEVQPAKDDLLIISNTLNHQPANDAGLALSKESNDQPENDLLVVSPYAFGSHLLRLDTVSKPNQLLAKALTQMRAVRADYATAAYIESFNWSTIVDHLRNLSEKAAYDWQPEVFYIVVFRSRVNATTDRSDLGLMDADAHEEAMVSGGLLKYWFGVPDANRRNLATCKCS